MQVYDIEVEGTHNFIVQGIVAHNTYTGAVSSPAASSAIQMPEEIGRHILQNLGVLVAELKKNKSLYYLFLKVASSQ